MGQQLPERLLRASSRPRRRTIEGLSTAAPRATVHAVCGLPASGKTTLARRLEREHEAVRFSADEWVLDLYGPEVAVESFVRYRHRVWETIWSVARRLLALGIDVVLDFSFYHRADRDRFRERAVEAGADFRMYYLECPEATCRARLRERNAALSAHTFRIRDDDFDVLWASFEVPTRDEELVVVDGMNVDAARIPGGA